MSAPDALIAVVVSRHGIAPAGADEATGEANGRVIVIGTDAGDAAASLKSAVETTTIECPGDLRALAEILTTLDSVTGTHGIVLPASPDGRDLAPLLAHQLRRPLLAAAMAVRVDRVTCVRTAGRVGREYSTPTPFVATLLPGLRGVSAPTEAGARGDQELLTSSTRQAANPSTVRSVTVRSVTVLPPDPATMDLTEAPCIVGGGLGLGSKDRFDQLGRIGELIGASLGGTRVASDAGWISFERQIGTTGVAVNPNVYIAFGISGATQHTSGLGDPEHIISVNTDASCPMMTMSDVAIVSDAQGVLDALETLLRQLS